jgi:hypothetical protein
MTFRPLVFAVVALISVSACETIGEQVDREENQRKRHITVKVEECGYGRDVGASGIITNDGSETYRVFVEIGYYDGDLKVDSSNDSVTVRAHGQGRFEVFGSSEAYDDCKVDDTSVRDI